MQRLFTLLLVGLVAVWPLAGGAVGRAYLDPDPSIASAFLVKPQLEVLWLTQEVEAGVARILGHPPAQLRQRYWTDGKKMAWVLEEIGKEEPITAGFVVKDGRIEQTRVLVYRESRGMEVRYPAFINQFTGAGMPALASLRCFFRCCPFSPASPSIMPMPWDLTPWRSRKTGF